ncbi:MULTISPECIES: hypothetical protein [unclassified Yoonia]|uniref:hypothetical protein n=1 Tax=unclassified Yoonia TaxID=2629118 RepID=UPI002AFE2259|nr:MULTISPECIES: hypothetical protein [unclassified Yoonia]
MRWLQAAAKTHFAALLGHAGRITGLILALALAPATSIAQDGAAPEPATAAEDVPAAVQVTLEGFTLAQEVSEEGEPVFDDNGDPVMIRVPLAESVVTPGDQVLYVITLDNPTEEPATDVQLGAQVAAEVELDPFSFTGPDGLEIAWADAETPDVFRPVFEQIDGEEVMTADLETLRSLQLTLPELAPTEQFNVTYLITLR